MYGTLKDKIRKKTARIGIVGLGYVGLPLAVSFAEEGFRVTGIDLNKKRVKTLKTKASYIMDVATESVGELVSKKRLTATSDYSLTRKLDVIIICVPTPLSKTKEPDISMIMASIENIIANRKRGQLYVLESTTYPGTTEEMLLPKFADDSYKVDRDFFLAFSPERVDPRNRIFNTENIPKVVGGVTRKSTLLTKELYSNIVEKVICVSSSKVAEMAKLLENTFRSVNIGLVNEMALMSEALNVDIWEVIEAAGTKPFGFMSFYPGPGIGGHCINIDPLYLSWKASLHGFRSNFIEVADTINSSMPRYVVNKVIRAMNKRGKAVKDSKIMVLGVAYKKDINDTRESPSLEIIRQLIQEKAVVNYSDPHVPRIKLDGSAMRSRRLSQRVLKKQDCVILATDHESYDYKAVLGSSKLIFDARNAFNRYGLKSKKIVRL